MKYDRIENTRRNVFFGMIFKAFGMIMPFLIRVVIIRTLGAEYTGLSSLFSSILTVLSVSELGFGSAIVFSMYKPIANDDFEKVNTLLSFYKKDNSNLARLFQAKEKIIGVVHTIFWPH